MILEEGEECVARVDKQERRFTAKWERVVWAVLDAGKQMDELKIVSAVSEEKIINT